MDQTKPGKIKVIARVIQAIILQILVFFIVLLVLSFADTLLAFLLNYDRGKAETPMDYEKFCTAFCILVALPTSIAASTDKLQWFRRSCIASILFMEIYFTYQYVFCSNVELREFIVLSLALLISCAISLPLFRVLK